MVFNTSDIAQIVNLLLIGKIGIMPTDTVYGIHCIAKNHALIQKVAELKGRASDIPVITLIPNTDHLRYLT